MSHVKPLTVSLVIPAYNEERHLAALLDSVAAQTVTPHEVIVVDNNSTDRTEEIARRYPFVQLLQEPVQGLIAARNRGFNAASGDIIGRCNADVTLKHDWVERIQAVFSDPAVAAVTGPATTRVIPWFDGLHSTIWSRAYFNVSAAVFGVRILWGANMAVRRGIWLQIRNEAATNDKVVHEDQDLSLLIAGQGKKARLDMKLLVDTREQSYFEWPKFREYMHRRWTTHQYHKQRGTLDQPSLRRLPRWRTLPLTIVVLPLAALFTLGSLVIAGLSKLTARR